MKNIKSMYILHGKQTNLLIWLMLVTAVIQAQDIHFTFANTEKTIENGKYYYETDVMIEASEAFKLGSGQIYLTYNPEAFGANISKQSAIAYSYEPGYILGENYVLPAYKNFVQNDNTDHRISFAFQQGVSEESMTRHNVTATARALFHIRLKYVDATKDAMIAFEKGSIYQDQFFTACGSMLKSGAKAGFPDCANLPGKQLVNDTYDSSGASLQPSTVEEQNLDTINLYPNPAKDHFKILGLGSMVTDVRITNIQGKLVQIITNHNLDQLIDISQLPVGVYVVQLDTPKTQKSYKLIRN